ncbi:hypothetical protein RYX36_006617 [Vicia faba]
MAFLERVEDNFVSKDGGEKASTPPPNNLNKEFGLKLKEHKQACKVLPIEIWTVRMLREELQLLQEPGLYIGEVVKVIGKNKVLVKVS